MSPLESPEDTMRGNHRELTPFFGSDDEVVEDMLQSSPERNRNRNKINRNRHSLLSKLSKYRNDRTL
jgi:hypothetical protein